MKSLFNWQKEFASRIFMTGMGVGAHVSRVTWDSQSFAFFVEVEMNCATLIKAGKNYSFFKGDQYVTFS